MRILVINVEIPLPPVGGGRMRAYQLLRALATRHELTLVGFTYSDETHAPPPFPIQIIDVPWEMPPLYQKMYSEDPEVSQHAHQVLQCEIEEPWFVSYFQSPILRDMLTRLTRDESFDLILIEDSDMAQYLPVLPPDIAKVLDFQNVYTLLAKRAYEDISPGPKKEQAIREFERTQRFEKGVASQCQFCLACSDQEAAAARDLLGIKHIEVVPNGVDTSFFTPSETTTAGDSLLFTGTMSYPPNIEAVRFFTKDILPLIHRDMPNVRLHIVGMKPTEEVARLASDTTIIHGGVPDIRPYYANADIVVVPLLHGGGTRLKILEAAASGKAIVTTALGAEGLDFVPGKDLVIADSAADFAKAVLALAKDDTRRRELGRNARRTSLKYNWQKIGLELRTLLEQQVGTEPTKGQTVKEAL